MLLEDLLNVPLDICLLVRKTMVLFATILKLILAFILPVEFVINISSSCGDWV